MTNVVRLKPLDIFQSKRLLPREVGPQIVYVLLIGGHEQVAMRFVSGRVASGLLKAVQERNGIQRHSNIHVGGELCAHASHALAGGSETLPCFTLHDQHVLYSSFSEMKSNAGTDDARAYDDDVG